MLDIIMTYPERNHKFLGRFKRKTDKILDKRKRASSSDKLCATPECKMFGKQLKQMINESVDPCDDFYEFVCGKYSRSERIDDDEVSTGLLEKADQSVQELLREHLSGKNKKKDPKSIKYAANMYKACVDHGEIKLVMIR